MNYKRAKMLREKWAKQEEAKKPATETKEQPKKKTKKK